MKTFILIAVLLSLASTSYTQWYWQNPTPNFERELTSVKVFDQNKILIAGEWGILYMTTTGGYTWGQIDVAGVDFIDMDFLNDSYGIISSPNSMYLTTDGGLTWDQMNYPNSVYSSKSCFLLDSLHIYIASSVWYNNHPYATLFYTTDGGENWQQSPTLGWDYLQKVHFFNPATGLAAASTGKIFRTTDGGSSWTQVFSTNYGFYNLVFCDSLNGIANSYTKTFRTSDGGLSWQETTNAPEALVDMKYIDSNFIIGSGLNCSVYKSTNQGSTWIQLLRMGGGTSNVFNSIDLYNSDILFTAGTSGNIFMTPDSGQSWYSKREGSIEFLKAVDFPDRMHAMTVGLNGIILKTTSSGARWEIVSTGFNDDLYGINAVDSLTYITVGEGGQILKTTDGGLTWTKINAGTTATMSDIEMVDSLNGFMVGSNVFLKTTTGGDTWMSGSFPASGRYFNMCIVDDSTILISAGQKIFRTTDNGFNWEQVYQNPNYEVVYKISKLNTNTYLAGGSSNSYSTLILKSSDMGLSWIQLNLPFSGSCECLSFCDSLNGLLCLDGGEIYRTTNGGVSWNLDFSSSDPNFTDLQMLNINDATVVGHDGTIISTLTNHIMPVELTYFSGYSAAGKVYLEWETSSELNNNIFEIERRVSLESPLSEWINIGYKRGRGTTSEKTKYFYIDDIQELLADKIEYRLKQRDFDGSYTLSDVVTVSPTNASFSLYQNFPNPYNPVTTLSFSLPYAGMVSLKVYDILGRETAILLNEYRMAGNYKIQFNASSLASGTYFYQLKCGSYSETKKMMLAK